MARAPAQQPAKDRMARRAPPIPMSGVEAMARVFVLEAMLIVIAESVLDRPDIDDAKTRQMIATMRANALAITKQFNRPDLEIETTAAVDQIIAILVQNMPAMKGEFGVADEPADTAG